MKNIALSLIAFAALAQAHATETRNYELVSSDGSRIPTTIVWENIQGHGTVSGLFRYAGGDLHFTGSNSGHGDLRLVTENGVSYELFHQRLDHGFAWVGQVHFTHHSENASLVPLNSGNSFVEEEEHCVDAHHYTIVDSTGDAVDVVMIWENIAGNGAVEGHLIRGNQELAFSGGNPTNGYLWFRDAVGNLYEFEKANYHGVIRWIGHATTVSGATHYVDLIKK